VTFHPQLSRSGKPDTTPPMSRAGYVAPMLFRQFVDDDLGCGSYLVGDVDAGEAVVIDPAFAIEPYLAAASEAGVRIARVLETHTHADHVSGHGRLALEHGVPVSIHPLARPEYPFDPLSDGQTIRVGAVEIVVRHTPGHRPEHCAFVVGGELVLTGDSMFVGEAARPDLAIEAREGAADLWHSLQRLATLPGDTSVYPGHVSGSLCGTNMSDERSTTIGHEKATNRALRDDEATFVDESASLTTPRPPTTERCVALNRGPWVAARPPLELLHGPGDATVLDTRPVEDYAAGHAPGAISVALDGGSFATRAAFVLDAGEPTVLHARSEADAREAARLLRAVGLFEQLGYILDAATTEATETVTVPELARLLAADATTQVLDVREPSEHEEARLEGAIELPFREVRIAPPAALDPKRPVYTVCASGPRATLAASLLARMGFDARPTLGGGVRELVSERERLVESRI
jgi:glyoxylase-like metal-dependent hydrolase (beta-lactamase superfamily II)/rhodanese-related sulfurtransferase